MKYCLVSECLDRESSIGILKMECMIYVIFRYAYKEQHGCYCCVMDSLQYLWQEVVLDEGLDGGLEFSNQ